MSMTVKIRLLHLLNYPVGCTLFNEFCTENEIKTIEIDVTNEVTPTWLSIKDVKKSIFQSQTVLRDVMKNYFVFLDFFKNLEGFGSKIHEIYDLSELKTQTENIIFNEAKMAKLTNMDIDGIQKQITGKIQTFLLFLEYESLLYKINELTRDEAITIEQNWNANVLQLNSSNSNNENIEIDKNELLREYEIKLSKLEVDLKREKELRQVKYYRNDKKATEIKRLHKEKDDLLNH